MNSINKLTIGEIAKVEEISGLAISALTDPDKPKGKLMVALAYVIKRRENPKYSMLEAEALSMDEVTELLGFNEEETQEVK
jgi:hypothetical protein